MDPLNANGLGTATAQSNTDIGANPYAGHTAGQGGAGICNNVNATGALGVSTYATVAAQSAAVLSTILCTGVAQPVTSVAGTAGYVVGGAAPGLFAATANLVRYGGGANPVASNGGLGAFNEGMLRRQFMFGQDETAPAIASYNTGQTLVNSTAAYDTCYRSGKRAQTAGSATWSIYAKLRLKELSDFFEKMPLLRGSTIRCYLNTNQSVVTFQTVGGGITAATCAPVVTPLLINPTVSVIGGLTCPIMISSAAWGCRCSTLPNDVYTVSVSIYKNNFQGLGVGIAPATSQLSACRLYCPVYQMSPLAERVEISFASTYQEDCIQRHFQLPVQRCNPRPFQLFGKQRH